MIIIYIIMNITCMIYSSRANSTSGKFRVSVLKRILLRECITASEQHRLPNRISSHGLPVMAHS